MLSGDRHHDRTATRRVFMPVSVFFFVAAAFAVLAAILFFIGGNAVLGVVFLAVAAFMLLTGALFRKAGVVYRKEETGPGR